MNEHLRLNVQTIESKLKEFEVSNENIQLGKLEIDHRRIQELEKENEELKLEVCNNLYKQEQDMGEVLKQNQDLKLENCKLCELNEKLKKLEETCILEIETKDAVDSNGMTETDRIQELEREIEIFKETHKEQEEHHKTVYLEMYRKGQEAARFENSDVSLL